MILLKNITVRLSESDYELLREKVKKSGLSQAEFLRRAIFNAKIISANGIVKFIPELNKIGANINQIAKRCNQGNVPPIHFLKREVELLNAVLNKALLFLNGKALEIELSEKLKKQIDHSVKECCEEIINGDN